MVHFMEDNHVISYKEQQRRNVAVHLAICTSIAKSDFIWEVSPGKRKVKPAITFTFMIGNPIQWSFPNTETREKTYRKLLQENTHFSV